MARNMGLKLAIVAVVLFFLSCSLTSASPVKAPVKWDEALQNGAASSFLAHLLSGARHEQPIEKRTYHHGSPHVNNSCANATNLSSHKVFNTSTLANVTSKAFNTSTSRNVTAKGNNGTFKASMWMTWNKGTSKPFNPSKSSSVSSKVTNGTTKANNGTFKSSTYRNVTAKANNGTFQASTYRNVTANANNGTFKPSMWMTWNKVTSKVTNGTFKSSTYRDATAKANNGTFKASTHSNVTAKANNGTFKASTYRNVTSMASNGTFQASKWTNATRKVNDTPAKMASHQSGAASLHKVPSGSGQAVGGIHNLCPFPVHYSLVHPAGQLEAMPGLDISPGFAPLAPGQIMTHPFGHDSMGGVVWKVKEHSSDAAIIQFEHTWSPREHRVYYDISWVDGHVDGKPVFAEHGVNVQLFGGAGGKSHGHGSCKPIVCPAGDMHCHQAYHNPSDDWATHACDDDTSLVMVLCAGAGKADTAPLLSRRMETLDLQNVLTGKHPVPDSSSARETPVALETMLWIVGAALAVTGMGFSAL